MPTTDPDGHATTGEGWAHTIEIEIDDLENDGNQPWDPNENSGVSDVDHLELIGQTDADYRFSWNHEENRFDVREVGSVGEDEFGLVPVDEGTDVGSLRVRVSGIR